MATADVPEVDDVYELLSHDRGRLVLQYFDQHENPICLEDLSLLVARWEHDSGSHPPEQEIEDVCRALREEYLPWFANLGLVTYDAEGGVLRYDAEAITTAVRNARDVLDFVWNGGGDSSPDPEAGSVDEADVD